MIDGLAEFIAKATKEFFFGIIAGVMGYATGITIDNTIKILQNLEFIRETEYEFWFALIVGVIFIYMLGSGLIKVYTAGLFFIIGYCYGSYMVGSYGDLLLGIAAFFLWGLGLYLKR